MMKTFGSTRHELKQLDVVLVKIQNISSTHKLDQNLPVATPSDYIIGTIYLFYKTCSVLDLVYVICNLFSYVIKIQI